MTIKYKKSSSRSRFNQTFGFHFALAMIAFCLPILGSTDDSADSKRVADSSSCTALLSSPPQLTSNQRQALERIGERYKSTPLDKIRFSETSQYPVLVHGIGEKQISPDVSLENPIIDPKLHDAIVIGGGPSGLTASLYLSDKKADVLLLERGQSMGGLGAGTKADDIESGIGSAYSAGPEGPLEHAIYRHIGLGTMKTKLKIPSPIDSFLWQGKIYEGFWEDEAVLNELPASFAVFKHTLEWSSEHNISAIDQPEGQSLDALTAAQWIRQMPQILSKMEDKKSRQLFARLQNDPKVNGQDPMIAVLDLIDLYCRSALGMPAANVSALAFADFYISELDTRYTGTLGTGTITQAIVDKLARGKDRRFEGRGGATVVKIQHHETFVDVFYIKDGKVHKTRAKYVVFSAPIKLAPKMIENFAQLAPDRVPMIDKLQMTHYLVHVLRVKGHPFRATYDLWLRDAKYTHDGPLPDPTDVILGRWVDPKIKGFQGMRDFKQDPADDRGILTVYHPLGAYAIGKGLDQAQVVRLAEHAVNRVKEVLGPVLKERWGTELDVELVETYRWPNSIHVVRPGYLLETQTLIKPLGRIHFANNTLGTPEIEDALKKGKLAADEVLKKLKDEASERPRR